MSQAQVQQETSPSTGKGHFTPTAFSLEGVEWSGRGRYPKALQELVNKTGQVPCLVDGSWTMTVPESDTEKTILSRCQDAVSKRTSKTEAK